jgi:hypothetical protein
MARALTMTRTEVGSDEEPAYLAARREEAGRFRDSGDHLWLFRHETIRGVFLEFRESGDARRLAGLDPAAELWAEVELG